MKKSINTFKLEPVENRIIVSRTEAATQSKGGILLPTDSQEKSNTGLVLAVGPGRVGVDGERIPLQVKEGDRIIFSSFSGTEVKAFGEEYLIMTEGDVLAVVNEG